MQGSLRAWLLGRLDSLLTEEQRRLPPGELSRMRVLVGAAALNFVLALSNVFGPKVPAHDTLFRLIGIVFVSSYLSVLVLVRRRASPERAGLLLCTTLTVGIMLSIVLVNFPLGQTHVVIILTPALAVYLLGARLGFIFTALMVLYVLVIYPLLSSLLGGDPISKLLTAEQQRISTVSATLSLLSAWFLSWLHSSAREEATAALEESQARLEEMHRSLVEVSRQAGKAEVAVGVLHNVGNTLNSVTVSTTLVAERARTLRVAGVAKVAALLQENASDLGTFFSADPRGKKLPTFIQALSENLTEEKAALVEEVQVLGQSVEHLRAVVNIQQEHARAAGIFEDVAVAQLINDALRLQGKSLEELGIQVQTEYAPVPMVLVDRHKLLQILINLLSNARHALVESNRPDKQILIRVGPTPEGRVRVEVMDNGVGIPPENLRRIFSQGFTTRKRGHGFGLHISALVAAELGGSLSGASAGIDQGATFTLELPLKPEGVRA